MTLQQIVLSKNAGIIQYAYSSVLTLQQIVLSKNSWIFRKFFNRVLTLQQIVLSKNMRTTRHLHLGGFDFTTNCSF